MGILPLRVIAKCWMEKYPPAENDMREDTDSIHRERKSTASR